MCNFEELIVMSVQIFKVIFTTGAVNCLFSMHKSNKALIMFQLIHDIIKVINQNQICDRERGELKQEIHELLFCLLP